MEIGDIATWYAAGVSTLVLGWEVYKWKTEGARLLVEANADNLMVGDGPVDRQTRYVSVRVTNIGTQPTTITNLCGWGYKKKPWWGKEEITHFIIPSTVHGPVQNKLISPGEIWSAIFPQANLKEKYSNQECFVGIFHSAKPKKAIYRQIRFKE